jgi:hypothetical protein
VADRPEKPVTTKHRSTQRRGSSRVILYVTAAVIVAALFAAWSPDARLGVTVAGRPSFAGPIGSSPLLPGARTAAVDTLPAAAQASLLLQSLLGQHTVLAADMMRSRLRGDPDLAQAANAALGKNTDAMSGLIGTLFGDAAKTKFAAYWAAHVTALFNYARALADHDDTLRGQAQTTIVKFESGLAGFFAAASQGRLPRDAAMAAVRMHIQHLEGQADAYAAGNYSTADQIYREGYAHAFALGKVLASTLLPAAAAKALNAPLWRLRSELDRLLGEHVVVVIAAMRSGATNNPDFTAAARTVNANTRDLTGAMATLFGPAAAARFQSLWANHVDALIGYSSAVVKGDDAGRAAARAKLTAFEGQFAAFLGAATQNRMTAGALASAFEMHDDMLVREADAFAGKDYRQAHDLAYTTYQDMFTLAGRLATAFGATIAARLPVGAVQTGHGGEAAVVERRRHAG